MCGADEAIFPAARRHPETGDWYRCLSFARCISMEHRGVEYRIIQGIKRGFWKWSVETETGTKSGTTDSRDAAMAAAKRAIDNALDPKKR